MAFPPVSMPPDLPYLPPPIPEPSYLRDYDYLVKDYLGTGKKKWSQNIRNDPFTTYTDFNFFRRFRFSKPGFLNLLTIVELVMPEDPRSHALSIQEKLLLFLSYMSGNELQRVTAEILPVSQPTVGNAIKEMSAVFVENLKKDFLCFGPVADWIDSAKDVEERDGLPDCAFGVDGMHVGYEGAPRGRPGHTTSKDFFCRKGFYSQNVQVISDSFGRICDIDPCWPGSAHDSRVNQTSVGMAFLQDIDPACRFKILADSAYAGSDRLIKPFSEAQAAVDDNKSMFNQAHSQARVRMTENVYAQLKGRFRSLKDLRLHIPTSLDVITAAAILHNIGIDLQERHIYSRNLLPKNFPADALIED